MVEGRSIRGKVPNRPQRTFLWSYICMATVCVMRSRRSSLYPTRSALTSDLLHHRRDTMKLSIVISIVFTIVRTAVNGDMADMDAQTRCGIDGAWILGD